LVVLAAASCQLLSFLASAALSGIDVRSYEDDAEAERDAAAREDERGGADALVGRH